jgi:hypothetical protein
MYSSTKSEVPFALANVVLTIHSSHVPTIAHVLAEISARVDTDMLANGQPTPSTGSCRSIGLGVVGRIDPLDQGASFS